MCDEELTIAKFLRELKKAGIKPPTSVSFTQYVKMLIKVLDDEDLIKFIESECSETLKSIALDTLMRKRRTIVE